MAERLFGGGVELDDLPLMIAGHDAVEGRVKNRRFARLAVREGAGRLTLFGHVAEDQNRPAHCA